MCSGALPEDFPPAAAAAVAATSAFGSQTDVHRQRGTEREGRGKEKRDGGMRGRDGGWGPDPKPHPSLRL